jgi:hypothetical protein
MARIDTTIFLRRVQVISRLYVIEAIQKVSVPQRALSGQRERLNLKLHIIRQSRPRYQDLAIDMQPTRKPRLGEAFCVLGWVSP